MKPTPMYQMIPGIQTRWSSFENPTAAPGQGGKANKGAKGRPSSPILAGETKTLFDTHGSGLIHRFWMTLKDRSPEVLRSLRLDIYWDDATQPAVSTPVGDFFGIGLGLRTPFECALFSDPEGRSFNSFLPMPFRKSARITLTNESEHDLAHCFYDVNFSLGVEHSPETLYLHAHWRRESPNALGQEYDILPRIVGRGRFLGCNLGVMTNPLYASSWWGEGEFKVWFGDETYPTLCGTGTEDYIGTAWGQGAYAHRTQGCPIADAENRRWAFYRYHLEDPLFFHDGCRIAIQTIGGWHKKDVIALLDQNVPLIPVSLVVGKLGQTRNLLDEGVDVRTIEGHDWGWCNFWRQDDWSSVAYFYHESAVSLLRTLPDVTYRTAHLGKSIIDTAARMDA